jgi:hypothetical protein
MKWVVAEVVENTKMELQKIKAEKVTGAIKPVLFAPLFSPSFFPRYSCPTEYSAFANTSLL